MEKEVFSVSSLNLYIKNIIEGDFVLSNVLVKGEICNLNKHYTGHYYFSIKDEDSKIACMMFSFNVKSINFDLKNGDEVLISGYVSLYEKTGQYQLYARKIEPYGQGKELLKLLELKKKLQAEGLFDLPKKDIPKFPKSIGIISSKTGAAVHDLIHTIQLRYNPQIYVFPCLVQGENAPKSIINALIEAKNYDLDTLIISRGGGANEDLLAFNDEELVRMVASYEIPIISAVGHQIDNSIIDLVSDYSCITPTDAGVKATPNKDELIDSISNKQNYLTQLMNRRIEIVKTKLLQISSSKGLISPYDQYQLKLKFVEEKVHKLNYSMNFILLGYKNRLDRLNASLSSLNPNQTLEKGYSLVYSKDKKVINRVKDINENDELNIKLSDGELKVKVISKKEN